MSEGDGGERALSADLTRERVVPLLTTGWLGRAYEPLASCGSTNDEVARRAAAGAPAGLVVVADGQSGGRGRLGRSWQSPVGQNLYLSLLLRPDCLPSALPPLTLVVGAAVAEVLHARGIEPRLKWPNDILVDGASGARKLVGILTEMATLRDRIRQVVVGVGVNVNQADFPAELAGIATSLRRLTGKQHDRGALLADLLAALEPPIEQALRGEVTESLHRWRRFADLPRECRIAREGGFLTGTAIDVDETGALLVVDDHGRQHRVLAGELSPV